MAHDINQDTHHDTRQAALSQCLLRELDFFRIDGSDMRGGGGEREAYEVYLSCLCRVASSNVILLIKYRNMGGGGVN